MFRGYQQRVWRVLAACFAGNRSVFWGSISQGYPQRDWECCNVFRGAYSLFEEYPQRVLEEGVIAEHFRDFLNVFPGISAMCFRGLCSAFWVYPQ